MVTIPNITNGEASLFQPHFQLLVPPTAIPNGNIEQLAQDDVINQQILGSPYMAAGPNEFPQYADGDVLISSGAGQTWRLHSSCLKKHSKIFASLLDPNRAARVTKKQREAGMTIRWKLEMVEFTENPTDCRLRSFKLVDHSSKSTLRLNDDVAQRKDKYHKVYDNLFKCIYNIEPELIKDEKKTGGTGYIADAVAILLAAEHLDALHSLHMTLEGIFLRLGQMLWRHVAAKPERWAFMAARIRSAILFREAIVHVVGKLDMKQDIDRRWLMNNPLRCKILELAEKKVKEIKEKKLEVERRLLDYYPPRMMHTQRGNVVPSRATYATDIYLWQARSLVQQYISSSYFSNLHHRGPDGGVHFYRTIGHGGEAYLGKDSLESFYDCFMMSGKAKHCFLDALEFMKDELKPIVRDLLHDRSQAKRHEGEDKLPWLTCAKILEEEFPWEQD
ncbi:hypothetical protein LARI1_G007371 [Lachnellula arida]|uniref:BTB domain-containing protein n=1 Tax=Lachnellula arida TaxID=1316785 RepID=A0A8T9B428_9HELO|nr:hypothetical protein LARI1_G007371 [Lachnellula arida]